MQCRITDLRSKEIINVNDGMRFGYESDIEIDTVSGKVAALVVPGDYKFFWYVWQGR
jgi:YlmC/YmxH family sporulation protein